ncbi:MLP-like protein 28 [Hibiscus trionum]|uniref:MLP-like protein 28 n=1 Tax=Hibiscus trionum TaxID=183268 RepID=A0A9W7JF18_HIBTR|nr:MLP-like protein 28 [Hibiscus trionum]
MSSSSLVGKLEASAEIEASAEAFHHMLLHKPHHVSNASPNHVRACDLHHSDWGKEGSIICWTYFLKGQPKTAKEVVESVDPKNNSVTLRVVEGDILEEFKSVVIKCKATPSAKGSGCVVQWVLEYEKLKEDVAHPETTLEMLIEVCKDMGAHLTKP